MKYSSQKMLKWIYRSRILIEIEIEFSNEFVPLISKHSNLKIRKYLAINFSYSLGTDDQTNHQCNYWVDATVRPLSILKSSSWDKTFSSLVNIAGFLQTNVHFRYYSHAVPNLFVKSSKLMTTLIIKRIPT